MSTTEKHLIADAGVEHDTPRYVPPRHSGASAPAPAVSSTTDNGETAHKSSGDVMSEWEEL